MNIILLFEPNMNTHCREHHFSIKKKEKERSLKNILDKNEKKCWS